MTVAATGIAIALPASSQAVTTAPVAVPKPLDALVYAHRVLDFVTAARDGAASPTDAAVALPRAESLALMAASLPDDGDRLQLLDDAAWLVAFTGTGAHLSADGHTDKATTLAFAAIRPALDHGVAGVVDRIAAVLADPVTAAADGGIGIPGGVPVLGMDSLADMWKDIAAEAGLLVVAATQLVDAARVVAEEVLWGIEHQYIMGVGMVPTPDELVADAIAVYNSLNAIVGGLVETAARELDVVVTALLAAVDTRALLNQADTVLLYLGSQVNPLADGTAPTREQALTAAEAIAAYAEEQAGQDPDITISDGLVTDTVEGVRGLTPPDTGVVTAAPGGDPGPMLVPGTVPSVNLDGINTATGSAACATNEPTPCSPPLANPARNPVQHNPTLYLVFWGPKWTDATHTAQRNALAAFAGGLSGSAFQAVLDQYFDATGHLGTSVTFGGAWVDTRTPPSPSTYVGNADLVTEAAYARSHNSGWTAGRNVQYLIFPQEGASGFAYGSSACGYHESGSQGSATYVFSLVDYPAGSTFGGCTGYGHGNVTTTLLLTASHEYAEAVTDPLPDTYSAWRDRNGSGYEIADICDLGEPWGTVGGQPVTQIWNNAANSCSAVYGRGASYEVVATVDPPGGPYARGHAYPGGKVVVRNTGSVAWYTGGAHPIRLMTKNNLCSHFYDPPPGDRTTARTDRASTWVNCARVKGVTADGVVGPGELLTFTLPLRPDGTLRDNTIAEETFDLSLDGLYRVALHSGDYPTLSATMATYKASPDPADTSLAGRVVVAAAGSDVTVSMTSRAEGNAPWFGNEVVNLATALPPDHRSMFAAASWPKPPGVSCTGCRADRVRVTTLPGATYTFSFVLHVPAGASGYYHENFAPVADVPVVGGGVKTAQLTTPVTFNVVVLPHAASHEVTAAGVYGPMGTSGPSSDDPTSAPANNAWWGCAALAGADAVTTTITWCSATVIHADGTSGWSLGSPGDTTAGPAAIFVFGGAPYDQAAGDTVRLCWNAAATYPDGSQQSNTGCTE
jgi:hypothetical protein